MDYFPTVKWSGGDADLALAYRTEVKNSLSCNSNSSYTCMVESFIMYRTIFATTFTPSRTKNTRDHGNYRDYPVITP
jgi:hypothetical protein